MMVIVPNALREAIYAKLDAALEPCTFPDEQAKAQCRQAMYKILLAHYDEHGVIPEFTIKKQEP